jgi:uracil-DNA glycosylase
MDKQKELEALEDEIRAHKEDCLLGKTCKNIVPGDGSAYSQIMFIGEAPGAREDDSGKPFVGPAGKFLDVLLNSINLSRPEIYITNMVKCRPPENRDPLPEEIECCKPFLDRQIELINPKVIVPLGRYAMAKFTPGLKISEAHGTSYIKGGRTYFIMYHPAVALYNGSMREVLVADMKKLGKILEGEIEPENLDKDLEDIKKKLNDKSNGKEVQQGLGLFE